MSFTTVSVTAETLERLRHHKEPGQSFDDLLNRFMDDELTPEQRREVARRLRDEPDIPGPVVMKRLGLAR